MKKQINDQLISLASAIDRLDYAIKTSASHDHLEIWSNLVKWRFEGLTLLILENTQPVNHETLRRFQRETLPLFFRAE